MTANRTYTHTTRHSAWDWHVREDDGSPIRAEFVAVSVAVAERTYIGRTYDVTVTVRGDDRAPFRVRYIVHRFHGDRSLWLYADPGHRTPSRFAPFGAVPPGPVVFRTLRDIMRDAETRAIMQARDAHRDGCADDCTEAPRYFSALHYTAPAR